MERRKSNTERSRDALEMLSDRKGVLENHQQEVEQFLNNIFKGMGTNLFKISAIL